MKIIRLIFKCLICFIAASLLFWGGIVAILHTQKGKQWIFQHTVAYVEKKSGTEIQLENFTIAFPLQFTFQNLAVQKDQKPLFALDHAELRCSFSHLLQGRLVISSLHVNTLTLYGLPATENGPHPSSADLDEINATVDWDHPLFSFYAKVSDLQINHIALAPALLKEKNLPAPFSQLLTDSSLRLQGTFTSNPFRMGLVSQFKLTLMPEDPQNGPVNLNLMTQHHQLQINLDWTRCCRPFLNELFPSISTLALPAAIDTDLSLSASGSIASWRSLAKTGELAGDQSVEGSLKAIMKAAQEDPLIGENSILNAHFVANREFLIKLIGLKFISPIATIQGYGALSANKEIQSGGVIATFKNLEPLSSFFEVPLQGALTIDGEIKGTLDSPTILCAFSSPLLFVDRHRFEDAALTVEVYHALSDAIDGSAHLRFHFRQQPVEAISSFAFDRTTERLTFSSLKANLFNIKTTGELTYLRPETFFDGTLHAENADFNSLSTFLNHPLHGEGDFTLTLNSKKGFDFKLSGKNWRDEAWEAKTVSAHLHATPPLPNTKLLHIQSTLIGTGIIAQNKKIETAQIESTHQTDLSGSILKQLSSQWHVANIHWDTMHIAHASGRLEMPDPLDHFEGMIESEMKQVLIGASTWEAILGKTEFSPHQTLWPFHIKGQGSWKEDVIFSIDGNWHRESDHQWVKIDTIDGRLGPYHFETLSPIEYIHEPSRTTLTRFHMKLNDAEFHGSYDSDGNVFAAKFGTNALPSELIHFVAPEIPLTGRISFIGGLEGTFEHPTGELKIGLHHVQVTEEIFKQKPFIDGEVALQLTAGGLDLKSKLKGMGSTPFTIDGQLPFTLDLNSFQFRKVSRLPFHINLNAEGELAPYMHLFFSDATNLSGKSKIALEIGGDIDAPSVYGYIDFSEGTYESFATNTTYHHIQGRLEGNGSQIILSELSAQDNKNGSFSASGTIALNPAEDFPLSLEIHPKQIFIIDSDYANISASGLLTLKGNLRETTLTGNLSIDKGLIKLEESLPRSIKTVEVKYFNLPEGEEPPTPDTGHASNSSLTLDIQLDVPDNFEIHGNRLESLWKGKIHISGTPSDPLLFGDLRIVQGEYNFNGKLFTLNPGSIHFGGSIDKKTTLYIVASQDIDRIRAEIILKGPINKPVISFRSNPPLSQREVLSYILFNRGISDITADQGEQLSQSFIALNTSDQTNTGDDFLSRMRNKIGLDRLDFSTGSQEGQNFSLQLGKYITENIFVSLNQSISSAVPYLSVEIKLNKHLRLQADGGNFGDDNQFRTSLKWKKDY